MPLLLAIIIAFLLMFILGVDRGIITFVALALLLIFSVFCVIFFLASFINLVRSKKSGGRFAGFMYIDKEEDILVDEPLKDGNRIAFAAYYVRDDDNINTGKEKTLMRNLFPTDDIMTKLYKRDEDLSFLVCRMGKKCYVIDGVTKLIIFIGLPVFSVITGIIVPLIMQYAYIFSGGI